VHSAKAVAPALTFCAVAVFAPRPSAADSAAAEPDWEAKNCAFGWLPTVYSNPEIGAFKVHVNITTDDLLRRLRWGGGAGLEDRYKDFLLLADVQRNLHSRPGGLCGSSQSIRSAAPSEGG